MKAEHLKKVEARVERALDLLLPWETNRGEVEDPKDRLRDIVRRIDGKGTHDPGSLRNDIWALTELLETDIPELIQAVRDSQQDAREARRELSMRAGTKYQITITSDAPLDVLDRKTIVPEDPDGD